MFVWDIGNRLFIFTGEVTSAYVIPFSHIRHRALIWIFIVSNTRSICHNVGNIALFMNSVNQMRHWAPGVYCYVLTTMGFRMKWDSWLRPEVFTAWNKISLKDSKLTWLFHILYCRYHKNINMWKKIMNSDSCKYKFPDENIRGVFDMYCLVSSSWIFTWGTIKPNTYPYRVIQYLPNGV